MANENADWSDVVAQAAESYQQIAQMVIQQQNIEQAREDQRWYYEDQKNWNSPANQMMLRRMAGINPYSDFSIGSPSVPQPVNMADSYNDLFNSMMTSADLSKRRKLDRLTYELTLQQLELEKDKLSSEKDKLSSEKDLIEARKNLTNYQGLGVELDNYLKNALMQNKISISDYETSMKAIEDSFAYGNAYNDFQSRRYQADIDYYDSLTAKRHYQEFLPLLLEQLQNDVTISSFDAKQIDSLESAIANINSPVLQTVLRIVLMAVKGANQGSLVPSILGRKNKK